jgi:predicted Zn finger-like uncharacterized protein
MSGQDRGRPFTSAVDVTSCDTLGIRVDVRCERCNTEYEFDDALVSGRGTTVKCTNCGHKFKIRRKTGDITEDFWNVRTGDGKTLVFTSLRELQRAIQTHLVGRTDLLSRGGLPPKAIGQIPELTPFFDPIRSAPTLTDAHPPQHESRRISSRPPPPPGATAGALSPPARGRLQTRPDFLEQQPPRQQVPGKSTLIGTGAPDDAGVNAVAAAAASAQPAPPPMRKRMSSVPPPMTERDPDPEPDTLAYERPAPAPRWGPSGTMPPASFAQPPTPSPGLASAPAPTPAPQEVVLPKPAPVLTLTTDTSGAFPAAQFQQSTPPPMEAAQPPRPSGPSYATPPPPPVARASTPALATPPPARASAPMLATPPPPTYEPSSPLPPPAPFRRIIEDYDPNSDPPPMRSHSPSLPDAPASMGKRRSYGGFIVVTVFLACAGLLAAVYAKDRFAAQLGLSKPQTAAPSDPRVAGFLTTGEKALADGNLEVAKESFDKANALAEKDPHVLLDVARLAAARADVQWLKSRLLPADAADEHRFVRDRLAELSGAARKAADDAIAVAPDDPASLRAKIDALRISGDRDGARGLVSKIASSASQPESAYVLAALDLAENEPLWSTVLERLRLAAGAESGPGRARAALVYALARSGDTGGARAEIERLEAMSRRHELVPLLKGYVDRTKGGPVAARDAGPIATMDVSGKDEPPQPGNAGRKPGPGDPRSLVAAAEAARGRGDLEKAQRLYAMALDANPSDTEALNGLAAIAQARGDLNGAKASYKRVLSVNPSYVPALVGLADVEWASGDRAGAMKVYREIVERFPEGTYPARVKQRVEGGGAPPPAHTQPTATATAPTATSTSTAPPTPTIKEEPGF